MHVYENWHILETKNDLCMYLFTSVCDVMPAAIDTISKYISTISWTNIRNISKETYS